jgi:phospholipase/lecithinase/hemolysin
MLNAIRTLVLLAALAPAAAPAAPLTFDGLYAFGDSLTDNGNAYALSFGLAPESPPYYEGRFSNGPNWYDHVARVFRDEGHETRNYAFGGAWARTNRDLIPDLHAQRLTFRNRADPGPDALAAVWAGGNDLLKGIGDPGVRRVARRAADAATDTAAALYRNGIDTALIFNMPNLADIPRYAESEARKRRAAARGSKAYNVRLRQGIRDLRDSGMRVIAVDTYGIYDDVVANPRAFGIDNVSEPCLVDDRVVCTRREARRSAFFDRIHPSATLHAILGDHVLGLLDAGPSSSLLARSEARIGSVSRQGGAEQARVAPVPLPAPAFLLLGALACLGLGARRRRFRHRLT